MRDISDDIDLSVNYLDEISANYERVLFVDGNHITHVTKFPIFNNKRKLMNKIEKLNNNKIVYLPKTHYKLGKLFLLVIMVGDYDNNNEESINNSLDYFDGWIKNWSESQENSRMFIKNVTEKVEQHKLFQTFKLL